MSLYNGRHLGPHHDILSAEPDTEESKKSLVDEIKNRARAIFSAGNYMEAELLYDKAIMVKADAILYANRSAARLNLNMKDAALEDAKKAIELDAGYSKAYYRKGQAHNALEEYKSALEAFEKGIELDPKNKSFKEMAAKAKQMMEAQEKKGASAEADSDAMSVEEPKVTKRTVVEEAKQPGVAASKAPSKAKKTTTEGGGAGDDDEDDLKAENLRGYKTLADGRKTTYFNNVLSEDAKKLIGDIAPKKIEVTETVAAPDSKPGTGSAWNYAGTFEERNMTDWAKERLKELLSGITFVIPNVGSVIEVVKLKELEGDASVTFVRGKKKYLFDFVFTLDWEAELDCGKAKGSLKYPDVTPDNDDEYDTLLEVDQLTPPAARHFINSYIKSSDDGLQKVVKEKLREFMKDYSAF